uniref:Uncharacterized protein n=1 Tax=Rhizophora mucronata TaxID=61149 RepID=A0A2P2J4T6_RHIMU
MSQSIFHRLLLGCLEIVNKGFRELTRTRNSIRHL